jgi:hypothetical protein
VTSPKHGKPFYPKMWPDEYSEAIQTFKMDAIAFSDMIGVGWRQGERYLKGDSFIPDAVAKLIRTAVRHRLSPEDIG